VVSGVGSWANYYSTANGDGAWANNSATAGAAGAWANYYSTANGRGSWAMGYGANASNDFTFVWSDGTAVGSGGTATFTVHAANGIRLLGGPITGDGRLITNVNAATLGGVALAGLVQTNAALDALRLNNGSGLTNLNLVGSGGSTNITGGGTWTLNSGTWTYAPTGITTEVQSALDGKLNTNGNAVGLVSGAKVETMTITNLTTEGSQTMNGTANSAPNQTAEQGHHLLTRSLGDARYRELAFHLPNRLSRLSGAAQQTEGPPPQYAESAIRCVTNSDSYIVWQIPTTGNYTSAVVTTIWEGDVGSTGTVTNDFFTHTFTTAARITSVFSHTFTLTATNFTTVSITCSWANATSPRQLTHRTKPNGNTGGPYWWHIDTKVTPIPLP
jgi:hypothetical protein